MKYYIIIFLLSIMLAGCSQNEKNGNEVSVTKPITKETIQPNEKEKKMETAMSVTKLDIENYNLDYNEKTDAQSFFPQCDVAKSEKGYYLWGGGNYAYLLLFFDAKVQKTVPLCNLPNCTHSQGDDTCNAFFSPGAEDMMWDSGVWYYEDYVYTLGCDPEDYVSIYRVKPDGSSREKYMRLYRADTTPSEDDGSKEYSTPDLIIHRGYVYYVDSKEKNPKLRRIKLGGTKTEILYETDGVFKKEGDKAELIFVRGYGDYIFFMRSSVFMKEQREQAGLYAYNIQTGEIVFVSNSIESDYTIFEDEIYYSGEKDLRKFSIQTQKDEKIMDCPEGVTAVSVDADNIAILSTEDKRIHIYDKELNVLYEDKKYEEDEKNQKNDEIGVRSFGKGDENFLFASFYGEQNRMRILDKSKLKDKTAKWELMY